MALDSFLASHPDVTLNPNPRPLFFSRIPSVQPLTTIEVYEDIDRIYADLNDAPVSERSSRHQLHKRRQQALDEDDDDANARPSKRSRLREKLAVERRSAATVRSTQQQLRQELDHLRKEVIGTQDAITTYKLSIEKAKIDVHATRQEYAYYEFVYTNKLQTLDKNKAELMRGLSDLQQRVAESQKANEEVEAQLLEAERYEKEINALELQSSELRAVVASLTTHIKILEGEILGRPPQLPMPEPRPQQKEKEEEQEEEQVKEEVKEKQEQPQEVKPDGASSSAAAAAASAATTSTAAAPTDTPAAPQLPTTAEPDDHVVKPTPPTVVAPAAPTSTAAAAAAAAASSSQSTAPDGMGSTPGFAALLAASPNTTASSSSSTTTLFPVTSSSSSSSIPAADDDGDAIMSNADEPSGTLQEPKSMSAPSSSPPPAVPTQISTSAAPISSTLPTTPMNTPLTGPAVSSVPIESAAAKAALAAATSSAPSSSSSPAVVKPESPVNIAELRDFTQPLAEKATPQELADKVSRAVRLVDQVSQRSRKATIELERAQALNRDRLRELEAERARVASLQEQLALRDEQLTEMTRKNSGQEEQALAQEDRVEQMQKQAMELQQVIEDQALRLKSSEELVESLQHGIALADERADANMMFARRAAKQVHALRAGAKTLQKTCDRLRHQVEHANQKLSAENARAEAAEAEARRMARLVAGYKEEVVRCATLAEKYRKQNKHLNHEMDTQYVQRLEELDTQMDEGEDEDMERHQSQASRLEELLSMVAPFSS